MSDGLVEKGDHVIGEPNGDLHRHTDMIPKCIPLWDA